MLYRRHELAIRTQYAELKERALGAGPLLPGTPGTLYERSGTGRPHWYRVYYAAPGRQVEDWVGGADDAEAVARMDERMAFARWTSEQVADLRRLGFQVADKGAARVLVELANRGLFDAGLVVVGTLAYMATLNELGVRTVAARTQDVDLARRQRLHLAGPQSLRDAMQATKLPFVAQPTLSLKSGPTSLMLPGRDGLRVDLLAPGRELGKAVAVPELAWHAQSIPHYEWLLDAALPGALLAGGHCIAIRLPRPERLAWQKLHASTTRSTAREKAAKDLVQAATLVASLVDEGDDALLPALPDAPAAVRRSARARWPALRGLLADHPAAADALAGALG